MFKLNRTAIKIIPVVMAFLAIVGYFAVPAKYLLRAQKYVKRQKMIITGELIKVGNRRIRLDCQGTGGPTVVLEAGLNMTHETWGKVPEEVSKFGRVCSYDRAGLGESDPFPEPRPTRTATQIVDELKELLANAGERPPFIIVGHSFGGIVAKLFAIRHPEDTGGLVLIDSSHENQYQLYAQLISSQPERDSYFRHESGNNHEHVDLVASADEVRSSSALPPIPVVVLSARGDLAESKKELMAAHDEMQELVARSQPGAEWVRVDRSGHFIQLDRPDTVIDAIRRIHSVKKD